MKELKYKPKIFIGGSGKQIAIVNELVSLLGKSCEVTPWTTFFHAGNITLTKLLNSITNFDYAIMIFAGDDEIVVKNNVNQNKNEDKKLYVTRDNVIFETGLFMSVLGKSKVIVLYDKSTKNNYDTKLLSDLSGFNYIPYDRPTIDKNLGKALIEPSIKILNIIENHRNSHIHREIKDTFSMITKTLIGMQKEDLDFELYSVLWRLKKELAKFKDISNGKWQLESKSTPQYLRYVFSHVLEKLNIGDEYLTLTNLDFWTSEIHGREAFIQVNMNALNKGVIIKRIVMLDKSLLDETKLTKEQKNEREKLKGLIQFFYENNMHKKTHLYFCICDDLNSPEYKHVPYVVIKRKRNRSINFFTMAPRFFKDKDSKIDFYYKNNDLIHKELYSQFQSFFPQDRKLKNVFTLNEFVKKLDISLT